MFEARDANGDTQQFKSTEASGEHTPHHHVDSSALPAGASTAARQDTVIARLDSVITAANTLLTLTGFQARIPTLGQKAMAGAVPVSIASDQSAVPVSATALPLPTGAATSANQGTAIAALGDIVSALADLLSTTAFQARVPTLGQKAAAGSMPVVLANDSPLDLNIEGGIVVDNVTVTSSALPTGAATEATLADIEGDVDTLVTRTPALGQAAMAASSPVVIASNQSAVPIADGGGSITVDGSVSLAAAIPAGTNNIGDVDVVSLPALPAGTNNIGDVDVVSLPALPAGTNNIGDVDVVSSALPTGAATESTLSAISATLTSILAALTVSDAFVTSIASADTSAHAFSSQAVKAPVHITIAPGMPGTLTIDDGDAGAVTLGWDDTDGHHVPTAVFYVSNLDQLRYTFSVHGGSSSFSLSTGI